VSALPNFRIETIETGSGITIRLGGELDSATCDQLLSRFEQLAGGAGVPDLVLDLSEVSFIDSSGMRAIILVERGAGERGFALTIVPPPEPRSLRTLTTQRRPRRSSSGSSSRCPASRPPPPEPAPSCARRSAIVSATPTGPRSRCSPPSS
jgi:anti-anti-sigma factor